MKNSKLRLESPVAEVPGSQVALPLESASLSPISSSESLSASAVRSRISKCLKYRNQV